MGSFFDLMYEPPVPHGQPYPPFTRVSLETTGRCTRSCWFCPAGGREPRGMPTMDDALYAKIVGELAGRGFDGVVQWFFVNEPLADRQHEARLRQLRAACPRCTIHLTTNWDVMHRRPADEQRDKIRRLFDCGVNSLNLNDYDGRGYEEVLGPGDGPHCWRRLGPKKRHLSFGPLPTRLHSWGGHCRGNAGGRGYCARPMRHVVVCWDGRVVLCCAVDPTRCETMGDARAQTLEEVWQSRRMFEYRWHLQQATRQGDCARCDERMAFPHVVRRVTL